MLVKLEVQVDMQHLLLRNSCHTEGHGENQGKTDPWNNRMLW